MFHQTFIITQMSFYKSFVHMLYKEVSFPILQNTIIGLLNKGHGNIKKGILSKQQILYKESDEKCITNY